MSTVIDGLVLYADGSFRRRKAGWGVHGYTYVNEPLRRGIGVKQLPTEKGYDTVTMDATVTPLAYIDAFGPTTIEPSNNSGELNALLEAIKIAEDYVFNTDKTRTCNFDSVLILTDSEYVINCFTKWMVRWAKDDWIKKDGSPVANTTYLKELLAIRAKWLEAKKTINLQWVKGHSGNVGNDLVDTNARTGSGGTTEASYQVSPVERYHNPTFAVNSLFLRTRMIFSMGGVQPDHGDSSYYYFYHLGKNQTFGHRQGETVKERFEKTDLLLGRRLSDATFCVVKLKEPDEYLEFLKQIHRDNFQTDQVELVISRLDHAYRPSIRQHIERHRHKSLIKLPANHCLITPQDDLVSKTLNPPRLAMEAVDQLNIIQRRLDNYLAGDVGKGVTTIDITEHLYGDVTKGKKTEVVLHKHITSRTSHLDIKFQFKNNDVVLKLILNVDIPNRNALARLAGKDTRVTLFVIANGPYSYSCATVFETALGDAIYQSPYTQFLIPKSP